MSDVRPGVWFVMSLAALAALGCSDSKAEPAQPVASPLCERFAPCGGDLVGRWTAAETCLEAPQLGTCRGEEMSMKDMTLSGAMEFTGSEVTQDVVLRGTRTAEFSPGCGGATTCGSYAASIGAPIDACVLRDGLCECAWPYQQTWNQPGSYEITGDRVAVTWRNGLYTDEYCVSGTELLIRRQTTVMRFRR